MLQQKQNKEKKPHTCIYSRNIASLILLPLECTWFQNGLFGHWDSISISCSHLFLYKNINIASKCIKWCHFATTWTQIATAWKSDCFLYLKKFARSKNLGRCKEFNLLEICVEEIIRFERETKWIACTRMQFIHTRSKSAENIFIANVFQFVTYKPTLCILFCYSGQMKTRAHMHIRANHNVHVE